jgi:5-methylcytosine-specific restriction protein A
MTRAALHNNWAERQRRAAVVNAWRHEYGDWCPGYHTPAHPAHDLCADHLTPVGAGGAEDGPLGVLCRACNSRKRDGRTVDRTPTIRSRNW